MEKVCFENNAFYEQIVQFDLNSWLIWNTNISKNKWELFLHQTYLVSHQKHSFHVDLKREIDVDSPDIFMSSQ